MLLCFNVDLTIPFVNRAGIFETPRKIYIYKKRPYYLCKHFMGVINIITNNKNNNLPSAYESKTELQKLSDTKLYADMECVDYCIDLIKKNYNALASINSSREASDFLAQLAQEEADKIKEAVRTYKAKKTFRDGVILSKRDDNHGGGIGLGDALDQRQTLTNESTKRLSWHKRGGEDIIRSNVMALSSLFLLKETGFAFTNGFYYTYTMDFRGRIYTGSKVGYTHYKFVRYCLKLPDYTEEELRGFTLDSLDHDLYTVIRGATDLAADSDYKKKIIVEGFYEFGKLNKGGLTSLTKLEFIKRGIDLFVAGASHLSIEDAVQYNYYAHAIKMCTQDKKTGYIFFKDATASGLQILGILLGCKDKDVER